MLVPVKAPAPKTGTEEIWLPLLDPVDVLKFVEDEMGLVCPQHILHEFWGHLRDVVHNRWAMQCPATRDHVPISLYGDECRYSEGATVMKCTGFFLSLSLWRPLNTKYSNFLLCNFRTERSLGPKTLFPILQRIVWSCNHAFSGLYPVVGPRGEALTAAQQRKKGKSITKRGTKYVVYELKGDWQWHVMSFCFLKCSWAAKFVCPQCLATSLGNQNLFCEFGDEASWRNTRLTTLGFINQFVRPRGPVCQGPSFPFSRKYVQLRSNLVHCTAPPPVSIRGPYLGLVGFDVSMIRFCSMHCCNLGLNFTCSGGALTFAFKFSLPPP